MQFRFLPLAAALMLSAIAAAAADKYEKKSSPPPVRPTPQRQQPAAAPHRVERPPQRQAEPTHPRPQIQQRNTVPVQSNTQHPRAQGVPVQPQRDVRTSPPQVYNQRTPTAVQPIHPGRPSIPMTNAPGPGVQQRPAYTPSPAARQTWTTPQGYRVERRGTAVRTLTTPSGMTVTHVGPSRQVVVRRADRILVTNARGHGFVQRDVVIRDQRLVQRTYYRNGIRYAHVYRPYAYRGAVLQVYTPVRYYRPGFYAYAYNPWASPVYYRWGYMSDPWYGAYGRAYFAPYPVYASPSLWLTDYLLATAFREAYQSRLDAGSTEAVSTGFNAPMGDDVKQLVSQEVRQQLDWQQSQVQQQQPGMPVLPQLPEPPLLANRSTHTLVVHSSLNADAAGQECTITEGDVLKFDAGQSISGPNASAQVLWSKAEDCRSGSIVTLPLEQLQEMQNHMLEGVNQGLEAMQTQQGQNGLPTLPATLVGSTQASFAAELPPPDPNVATELWDQAHEADNALTQVAQDAIGGISSGAPSQFAGSMPPATQAPVSRPIRIEKNMTEETVIGQLGQPANTIVEGKKKRILIYTNPNLKITLEKGKVHKVE